MTKDARDSKTVINAEKVFKDFTANGHIVNIGSDTVQKGLNVEDVEKLIAMLRPAVDQSDLRKEEKAQIQQQIEIIEQETNSQKPNGQKIMELLVPLLNTAGKIATVAKALNDSGILRNILPGLPGS